MSVASPAFTDLCQAQFQLLQQTLGTISAVIYVTETAMGTPPDFIPVFRYPQAEPQPSLDEAVRPLPRPHSEASHQLTEDTNASNAPTAPRPFTPTSDRASPAPKPAQEPTQKPVFFSAEPTNSVTPNSAPPNSLPPNGDVHTPPPSSEKQVVLPLIHQDTVVGAMVILHHERHWHRREQQQLQQVADSIAAGYILESQNQWLSQQLQAKRQLQGQQSEIFHNLLHQFRNPLTALGTFGKLLLKRLPTEDPNRSIATSIVRESERLNGLVKDFDHTVEVGDSSWQTMEDPIANPIANHSDDFRSPQSLAESNAQLQPAENWRSSGSPTQLTPPLLPAGGTNNLAAGLGHQLTLVSQPLFPLLEPLLTLGQTLAPERQRQFTGQLPDLSLRVTVDTQAFQEVIRNLLDNALKYARVDDWVWLQVRLAETTVAPRVGIAIGDTGRGIPLADQARLFERNYRGIQATGNLPGTGLGLAIARDLVTQMQGEIELISPIASTESSWVPSTVQAQGLPQASSGTLFIVWLPLA